MEPKFRNSHHQAIGYALACLNGSLLAQHHCFFAGGTAIALLYGEYRISVDMDFLVSNIESYRRLRLLVKENGLKAICRAAPLKSEDIFTDQYGVRTWIIVGENRIKFEIVFESRMQIEPGAGEQLCGVPVLTETDRIATKILANSDRWNDQSVFSRDIIDLAMIHPAKASFGTALKKATGANGQVTIAHLQRALDFVFNKEGWLDLCMDRMAIAIPKALLWKNLQRLEHMLPEDNEVK